MFFVFSRAQRISVFIAVGWLGFALQLTALALLTSLAHWPWLPATIVAVELAVVHNFIWHERVTWCDRTAFSSFERFARFNIATGMTSIAGNIVLMAICIGVLGLPPIVANAIAVGTMSVVNFFVADRWVFAATVNSPPRRTRGTPVVVRFVAVLVLSTTASAAAPHDAVDAWNRYVVETEARFEASASSPRPADYDVRAEGESLGVPSGTISRWRGSVFIPGARLDQVLNRLQYPGTPPPQDDVVSSRVISRFAACLHPARAPRHRHRHLRYRARDDVPPPHADDRHRAQRRDAHRRSWRRRSRVSLALALVLALRAGRRRRARGPRIADAQPRRAGARPADRVADRVAHREGVDGQNARGVTRISRPDTRRQPHALTAPD
jgi:putative flippase GtrA